eukprot:CAMPEP_0183352656 /NCGR_PEP_ID=MMETSP0164_2-20130417/29574_1 /TAXON_ID=221442 /ORGANISM="Coccolithus pelagicus ssp braarudi, Strain PLY182g" /LENGTH=199 /DNA_ID=CAMNT_0025525135 /DNA_START=153 /DNA_END=752 /DNA_ORIENTATION=-
MVRPTRGDPRGRSVGEIFLWLKYIVTNYDALPPFVVLLSDSGPHWHSPPSWAETAMRARPVCRVPLGMELADGNNPARACKLKKQECKISQREKPAIDALRRLFGMAAERSGEAADRVCCSEVVLSRRAIRVYSNSTYTRLMLEARSNPDWAWGFAMERMQDSLFGECRPVARKRDQTFLPTWPSGSSDFLTQTVSHIR